MATKNILVRGGADFSGLKKELQKTQKKFKSFQSGMSRTMKRIGIILGGIGLAKAMQSSMKAADYQLEQETKLAVVMKQRMNATDDMIASIKQLTAEQQRLGVIGDEIQMAGAQQLATFLRTTDSLKTLIPAMNNLAAQQKGVNVTGQDMVTIANMMGKVLEGNVGALKRAGISFTEAEERILRYGTEQERAAILAQVINNNVGQMNEALANTPAGRMQQLRNVFGDMKEEMGKALIQLRDALLPFLSKLVDFMLAVAVRLQQIFGTIAYVINSLFGTGGKKQVAVTQAQAGALGDVAEGYEEVGKAAQKAKKNMAGFDEITTIGETTGTGPAGLDFGTIDISGFTMQPIAEEAFEVSERVKNAVEKMKVALDNFKAFYENYKNIIIVITTAIATVFASFWIMSKWATIVAMFKLASATMIAAISAISVPVLAVATVIGVLVGAVVYLWKTNEQFRNAMVNIWNQIQQIFKTVWQGYIVPIFTVTLNAIKQLWDDVLKDMVMAFMDLVSKLLVLAMQLINKVLLPITSFLINTFGPIFKFIFGAVLEYFRLSITAMVPIITGLIKALSGLIDFIAGVFTGNWRKAWQGVSDIFKGIFGGLYNAVKVPLNLIIDAINTVIRGLNNLRINIPSWVPGFGGKTWGINIPRIPKLARGGIIDRPTVAMIGERGPEAVVPLENTGFVNAIARAVGDAVRSAIKSNDQDTAIILRIDDIELGKAVVKSINKLSRQSGISLINI